MLSSHARYLQLCYWNNNIKNRNITSRYKKIYVTLNNQRDLMLQSLWTRYPLSSFSSFFFFFFFFPQNGVLDASLCWYQNTKGWYQNLFYVGAMTPGFL